MCSSDLPTQLQPQPQIQPQLQPQPQGNSATPDVNGSGLGAQNVLETLSNPVHVGEPSSATAGQKGEEHYILPGDGPGVALAHKIMATCPVSHPAGYGNNGVWLSAPPLLACVAGTYTGRSRSEELREDISYLKEFNILDLYEKIKAMEFLENPDNFDIKKELYDY